MHISTNRKTTKTTYAIVIFAISPLRNTGRRLNFNSIFKLILRGRVPESIFLTSGRMIYVAL